MSGKRKEPLITGNTYHVFNRAIAKQEIFFNDRTIKQGLDLLRYYKYPQEIRYSQFSGLTPEIKKYYIDRTRGVKVDPFVKTVNAAF